MPITPPTPAKDKSMALPPEVQTLLTLVQRQTQIETRRAALQADEQTLEGDFLLLFASGALGVSEANKIRLVHVRTQAGKVRILKVVWTGLVNGVNTAAAEIVDVDEAQTP